MLGQTRDRCDPRALVPAARVHTGRVPPPTPSQDTRSGPVRPASMSVGRRDCLPSQERLTTTEHREGTLHGGFGGGPPQMGHRDWERGWCVCVRGGGWRITS